LEVLKHIHVVNDGVVSSNSWERESIIVKFPGVDLWDWSSEFARNFEGIVQIGNIEMSGELIDLPSQFIVTDPESLFTLSSVWSRFDLIDDTFVTTPPVSFDSNGGSHSD
jgi:hypothetical protein